RAGRTLRTRRRADQQLVARAVRGVDVVHAVGVLTDVQVEDRARAYAQRPAVEDAHLPLQSTEGTARLGLAQSDVRVRVAVETSPAEVTLIPWSSLLLVPRSVVAGLAGVPARARSRARVRLRAESQRDRGVVGHVAGDGPEPDPRSLRQAGHPHQGRAAA